MRKLFQLTLAFIFSVFLQQGMSQCSTNMSINSSNCPTVQFSETTLSNYGLAGWSWKFGDGAVSSLPSPSHTYAANGSYQVTLTVIDSNGCQANDAHTLIIGCLSSVSCNASFQWTFSPNGCPTVVFADKSMATPGTITSWDWNFGDGATSSLQHPVHYYTATGNYPVCLTITTSDTCTHSFCDTIAINCPITGPSCNAAFQWTFAANGCPEVRFINSSTSSPGAILSYAWDFGDGNSSTLGNPIHTYSANGDYISCLSIFTADSCTSTFCDTVSITCFPGPTTCNASFLWSFSAAGCPEVRFNDFSTASPGTITSWNWDFGDGITSTQNTPIHSYAADGNYLVSLNITTSDTCTSTFQDTVIVDCLIGIEEEFNEEPVFRVFPNPARDQLFIEKILDDGKGIEVELFTLQGKSILSARAVGSSLQLELHALNGGIYLLKIRQGEGFFFRKLLVE
ncbi:MAG: PKD domain-containing protein [Bacteroidia bacterium]|nr:PKD domain-containing protein [Bacteroidia bacterium]